MWPGPLPLHVPKYGIQVYISLKPEQAVGMNRAALVRFHSTVILANTPKHRILPCIRTMLEECRDILVGEGWPS